MQKIEREVWKNQPLFGGKLKRSFLMQLEEGNFLSSGKYSISGKPSYAEEVSPLPERQMQWERIVQVSADRRNCLVFRERESYEGWLAQVRKKYSHLFNQHS